MPIYKRTQPEVLGFLNAGGSPNQYDDFNCNIKENLNPRHSTEFIHQEGSIFHDPSEDDTGLGENPIESFGLSDPVGVGLVEPHLTNNQANHFRSLMQFTRDGYLYHELISDYTRNSSPLNGQIYQSYLKGEPPKRFINITDEPDIDLPFDVRDFDKLIASHRLPHDINVYSGIHWDPRKHAGKIITLPAYTSTSLSPHVAKDFGKVFMENGTPMVNIVKLHLPKGHPFVFADKGSFFPGQSEIILPRNLRIQMGIQPMHHIIGKFDEHWGRPKKIQHFQIWNGRILPSREKIQ